MKQVERVYWSAYLLSISGVVAYDELPFEVGMVSVIGMMCLTMALPVVLLSKKML